MGGGGEEEKGRRRGIRSGMRHRGGRARYCHNYKILYILISKITISQSRNPLQEIYLLLFDGGKGGRV